MLGKVNSCKLIFLLEKRKCLWLVGSFGEVTVLLRSSISGLSLIWDAFHHGVLCTEPSLGKPSHKYMCLPMNT